MTFDWFMDLGAVDFRHHPRRSEATHGNQFFVDVEFPKAGIPLPPHSHPYGHVSRATLGRVAILIGDQVQVLEAGDPFNRGIVVPSGVIHGAIALDDGACMTCTHILRDDAGNTYPFEFKLTAGQLMAATGRA